MQYITAVLPAGPGGESEYVTLPADPRVLSGECSYAMLQQPDGSRKIVMMENTNTGTGLKAFFKEHSPPLSPSQLH